MKQQDEYQSPPLQEASPARIRRTLYISVLAIINAALVGFIAKGLLYLINFFTNIFFFGRISFAEVSPADNALGWWVIAIPVAGGLIVGVMARFGSQAIRGHGIPEAMEQVIRNGSRIHPLITVLKPLSSAISIGTGGPFGAEGPIISTGGALGSFCGQTLHITAQERKVLLAAGATSGMTAIFGTPFAAILLAIELLLFEFSPRSFIPVVLACVTGACMHFLLFGTHATFPMPPVEQVTNPAVLAYSVIGIALGFASVAVTKILYLIEDGFEKLPIHWMWWPAIGGVVVGGIGTFAPETLGVGYENITHVLGGSVAIPVVVSLSIWKFVSWAVALGSGTSGGTLAPLLTIGSALGYLLGIAGNHFFPEAGISLSLAALVGMAALFAGSARALLTSIVFALETTMQERTLLPLIAGCVTSYMISFILMRGTIMTEKIKRRGVVLPENYVPDLLEINTASDALVSIHDPAVHIFDAGTTAGDVRQWLQTTGVLYTHNVIFVGTKSSVSGTISRAAVLDPGVDPEMRIGDMMSRKAYSVYHDNSLQLAVEFMLKTQQDILPVTNRSTGQLQGFISEHAVLRTYEHRFRENSHQHRHISMLHTTRRALSRGRKFLSSRNGNG